MAKPLRLPGIEEQRVLNELEIHLLLEAGQQDRWNQLVIDQHYLRNATLVGEHLRYAVGYQGQWLALLGWSAAACCFMRPLSSALRMFSGDICRMVARAGARVAPGLEWQASQWRW